MSDELKSAWQLALEKLDAEEGGETKGAPLTDDQKQRIAEVRREAKARRAEQEVLGRSRLEAARADADAEALVRLAAENEQALREIDDDEERRVADIRAESRGG